MCVGVAMCGGSNMWGGAEIQMSDRLFIKTDGYTVHVWYTRVSIDNSTVTRPHLCLMVQSELLLLLAPHDTV